MDARLKWPENMKLRILPIFLLSLLLTACVEHHGAVVVRSQPQGAEVVDVKSGIVLGVTPFRYWWRDDSLNRKFVNIRVQKEGYADKTNSFWVDLNHKNKDDAVENAQAVQMNLDKRN